MTVWRGCWNILDGSSAAGKGKKGLAIAELKALSVALGIVRAKGEKKIAAEIAQVVERERADLVGFKLWNGDGFSGPVRMAGYLKERFPGLAIVAGGPQVKFFKDFIFRETTAFDALAVGDGEAMINPLMAAVLGRNFASVPNIYYLRNGVPVQAETEQITDLDALPFPAYDLETYPASVEAGKIMSMIVLEDRRGCDQVCKFCVHPGISGNKPRSKSIERIIREFEAAAAEGVTSFRLGGSSTPSDVLRGIADGLEQKEMEVLWTAFARIRDSKPEYFNYLKERGLFSLFFGIESGNAEVLRKMNKGTSPEMIEKVIKAANDAGLFTVGSVIYPAPFDTAASRQETFDLITRINPGSVPVQFMGIYPGAKYALDPAGNNFEIVYPGRLSNWLADRGWKKKPGFYDPAIMHYLINYKLNLLFPPKFWRPLPWKMNGMTYRQYAAETQKFVEDLRSAGVLTMMTDDAAMMAQLGGYDFRDFARESFRGIFTGDAAGLSEMVRRINAGAVR